jgi:hypothetical protein
MYVPLVALLPWMIKRIKSLKYNMKIEIRKEASIKNAADNSVHLIND